MCPTWCELEARWGSWAHLHLLLAKFFLICSLLRLVNILIQGSISCNPRTGVYKGLSVKEEAGLGAPDPILAQGLWELSPGVLQGLLTGEPLLWILLHQVPDEVFG